MKPTPLPLKMIPSLKNNFFLIAGPCVVESESIVLETATTVKDVCLKYDIPYIFKSSYRKANRSKLASFTGIGDTEALEIINRTGASLNIPTLTDIHTAEEAALAAGYVDVLQIPAFLCRQTDLLIAAARTGKTVNIKKGQFMSAFSMKFALEKVFGEGNNEVMLTERGSMFGYNDLIVDFRNIPVMKSFGVPVVVDVTHALQKPNNETGVTGGQPEMIETLAKAAIACGADGLFIETHPDPAKALSDGANMLPLNKIKTLLEKLVKIRKSL